MTDRATLEALLSRVESATGADRELDYDIPRAIARPPEGAIWTTDRDYYPPITSSLDAVLALVERELPGWKWTATNIGYDDGAWQGKPGALLKHPASSDRPTAKACAATPALALLAALLRAKIAEAT